MPTLSEIVIVIVDDDIAVHGAVFRQPGGNLLPASLDLPVSWRYADNLTYDAMRSQHLLEAQIRHQASVNPPAPPRRNHNLRLGFLDDALEVAGALGENDRLRAVVQHAVNVEEDNLHRFPNFSRQVGRQAAGNRRCASGSAPAR